MKPYLRLLRHLKPYWMDVFGALICMLVMTLCNLAIIPLAKELTNAITAMNFRYLNFVSILAVITYFGRGLFTYGQVYLMAFVGLRTITDIRVKVYKNLQNLSLDFFTKWRTGEIISRMIDDTNIIQTATMIGFTEIFPHTLTLIAVSIYLFYLSWRLALITIFIMPLFAFIIIKFGHEMREFSHRAQKKVADISSILQEIISNIRVVKAFTMENIENKRFKQETETNFDLTMRQAQIDATQRPIMGFLQVLGIVAVVWYGGYEVLSGRLTPGTLVAFFAGIALLIDPIIVIGKTNIIFQRALASAERSFELMDISPTVQEIPQAQELKKADGKIEFKNTSFSYDAEGKEVLKKINFVAAPGEIIALVGPSGAGKTTFVNLIPRFYDPTKGEILLDEKNIKEVTLYSLRTQIGIVPQETQLFSATVRDNIAYGKTDATDEEIIKAAKTANAHKFISALPQGYQTHVGERGITLSGGQRQRIAIARAVLRNPRILILDEATSSLDTESEQLVQEAMQKLMAGRTTFVIAHRLSTVHRANRIILLDKGKIIETGTHNQLLENGGLYKKLHDMQFKLEA